MVCTHQLFAQTTTPSTNKYFGIFLTGGRAPYLVTDHHIDFAYVDESPSRDNLQSSIDIEAQKQSTTLGVGLEYHSPKRFFVKAGFSGAIGQVRSSFLDIGMGYDLFGNEKVALRGGASMSFGAARIALGDVENNDLYIQVNTTKFYSESVSVDLSPRISLLRPEITFVTKKGRTRFMALLGYNLPTEEKKAVLYFDGKDENDKQVSASESLNANNVYLEMDGKKIKDSFIKQGGLVLNVGLLFTLTK